MIAHRVRRRGRLADGADVEAPARPAEVERNEEREDPRGVHERRLVEEDGADHGEVSEPEHVELAELVDRGKVGETELRPEVRGQAESAGEDREREPRDDLVRAKRDHEERVDRGQRRPRQSRGDDGQEQRRRTGAVEPLRHPEPDRCAEEHHPLNAEVEDARALRQELSERRVQERRAVENRLREHDHEQAVVDAHSPARLRGRPPRAEPRDPQPVAQEQLAAQGTEEDDSLHHAHEAGREVRSLQRVAGVQQPADEHRHETDGERVVARERRHDDARVAESRSLETGRAAVERVREVADLARPSDARDRAGDGHDREDLPACPHAGVPRSARRVGDDADLEPEPHPRVEHPERERGQDPEQEPQRDDHRRAEGRPVGGLGHRLALRERARLERRRVAPVRRAVEDQVREEKAPRRS